MTDGGKAEGAGGCDAKRRVTWQGGLAAAAREREVDLSRGGVSPHNPHGDPLAHTPDAAGLLAREHHARVIEDKILIAQCAHGQEALGTGVVQLHEKAKAFTTHHDA